MIQDFMKSNLAIVGGGEICLTFLEFLFNNDLFDSHPRILGVADPHPDSPGICYARVMGFYTTDDYREFFRFPDLEVVLEITKNPFLAEAIRRDMPPQVRLIDQFAARSLWDSLLIEEVRRKAMLALETRRHQPERMEELLSELCQRFGQIIHRRNDRSREIEMDLAEHERAQAQIIQGSTIPTFVIDARHRVTHWNRAVERLTETAAEKMVDTGDQWTPFYNAPRPTMADVIVDQIDEAEILKLYGASWRKSALIEDAYEAEGFFPRLGPEGKWCWFTAAPIRSPDGKIIGAIETLWDKTEDKKAEQERERQNRLLSETARELTKSEKALTQIIQGSTIPTFVIDARHRVTHWNRAMERLTETEAENIVGTGDQWAPFYNAPRPTMADVIVDQIDETEIPKLYGDEWRKSALIEDAYEAEGFFPNLGPEGKWCWFTAAPIRSPDGKIIGAIETLWDKTEDKKAEQQREHYTRELSNLCSIYSALNSSSDLDAGIRLGLQEVQRFLGADCICVYMRSDNGTYRLGYNYGLTPEACGRIEVADETSLIHRVAQGGKFAVFEEPFPDGSDEIAFLRENRLVSVAYIPISSKMGETFGIIRMGSRRAGNFTADQQNVLELLGNRIGVAVENAILQERYIRSEEKYRSLFNNDPNPIFILDSDSLAIQDTNQRAQACYGYSRKEFLDKSFLDLGDDDDEVREGLGQLAPHQSVLFSKKRHYDRQRRPFYVNINASSADYQDRVVLIASTTDITESVEKETQLIQASKMTTLGTMAAGMAHELNQPLNVIQVCADFLKKMIGRGAQVGNEDLESLAKDIAANVQRAANIIKHMRDFSRQSEVFTTRVWINKPIEDVFKVMGHQLKMHSIQVHLDLDPQIPPILAEHNRLEQVFINLVTNAMDAMDEKMARATAGGDPMRLDIRSFTEDGTVVVSVTDTGTGMPPEVIHKIFEPFFTTKKVGKGTGLGVSISYGIVKDYGGSIDIRSRVGEGTTFELRFPAITDRPANGSQ